MNTKPIYFEMSNFDTPPDTVVRLGQIIHDFKDPSSLVAPPLSHAALQHTLVVHVAKQSDWQLARKRAREGSIGVFAQFLASIVGIGADAALLLEKEYEDIMKFDTLETHFIEPDVEYVRAAMASPPARQFHEQHRYKSAFMVTGVKIARGAAVERLTGLKYGVEGNVGVDSFAFTGVPGTAGPKASMSKAVSQTSSFKASTDFVFAYRLKKIKVGKAGDVVATKNYVRGAVHNIDADSSAARGLLPAAISDASSPLDCVELDSMDFGQELAFYEYDMEDVRECYDDSSDGLNEEETIVLKAIVG